MEVDLSRGRAPTDAPIVDGDRMLDNLTDDVVEAQERMNFVMERMSRLLKTKGATCFVLCVWERRSSPTCALPIDKCQLGLIIFLAFVLVVMVFLVIYT